MQAELRLAQQVNAIVDAEAGGGGSGLIAVRSSVVSAP